MLQEVNETICAYNFSILCPLMILMFYVAMINQKAQLFQLSLYWKVDKLFDGFHLTFETVK